MTCSYNSLCHPENSNQSCSCVKPSNLNNMVKPQIPGNQFTPKSITNHNYIIRPYDTFYSISQMFDINPDVLLEANSDVIPNRIFIGQPLYIPLSTVCEKGTFSYIIKKSKSLTFISRNFRISLNKLKLANPKTNLRNMTLGQHICIPKTGHNYQNSELEINFLYPLNWRKNNSERYSGSDGFFQVAAIGGYSLGEVCSNEAFHILKPYGSQPAMLRTIAEEQEACIMFPSVDQAQEMQSQAVFIVRYPKPVVIKGQIYNFFALWADKYHIKEIIRTITFITK